MLQNTFRVPLKIRANRLTSAVLRSNWGDTNALVMNVPFWEDITVDLEKAAEHCPEFGRSKEWGKAQRVLDLMYQCEDVRDYINEILEALDRLNPRGMGVVTTQRTPGDMDERIDVILSRMSMLQKSYPEFDVKIDESVGKGVKLLRSRYKFDWPGQHSAYF